MKYLHVPQAVLFFPPLLPFNGTAGVGLLTSLNDRANFLALLIVFCLFPRERAALWFIMLTFI